MCQLMLFPDPFFWFSILEVRINSTERYHLSLVSDCLHKHIVLKYSVVDIVMTNLDSYLISLVIQGPLVFDLLFGGEALI